MKKYTIDANTAKIKTIYVEYIPHEKDKHHFTGDPLKVQDKNGRVYVTFDHRLRFWGGNLPFYFDTYEEAVKAFHVLTRELELERDMREIDMKIAAIKLAEEKRRARKFRRESDKLRIIHG